MNPEPGARGCALAGQTPPTETLPGVVAPTRTDDIFYIYPSVGFDITKHANLQIGYRYMRDESSLQTFSYADNQATVQLNLSF